MNKEKPFFSVVIPLYNKAPHVVRSVGSVLNQNFQNFELIIVNDASTDGSVEEVQKFNDQHIRLLHRDTPGPGGYAARNLGIKKAKGQWIAFLDADDEWFPEHLERMHALSKQFPDVYIMGCGWKNNPDGTNNQNKYYKLNHPAGSHTLTLKDYLINWMNRSSPVWTSVACIKKASSYANNLFPADTEARRSGDMYAWLKMLCFHKKMAWSNHLGAVYYKNSDNMVTKTAPGSSCLMEQEVYQKLSIHLNPIEKILLRKYLNRKMMGQWMLNASKKHQNFDIKSKLYWKNDIPIAAMLFTFSFLPNFIISILYNIRSAINNYRAYKK